MELEYDKDKKTLTIVKSDKIEYRQVKNWLNRLKKGYQFSPAFKRKVWDGKIKHFKDGVNISVGLWKEVYQALNNIGHKMTIVNKEEFKENIINSDISYDSLVDFCKEFFKDHYIIDKETNKKIDFFPYDHQIEIAYKIIRNKFCTAEVATGGGKSLIISIVFFYLLSKVKEDAKFLLIVPSITLVNQFYDEILNYNFGYNKENTSPLDLRIQEIMSDKPRVWHGEGEPNIIISTYQSLSKVKNFGKDFYTQFYAVACDEAHQAKAESFNKIMTRTKKGASYQFGVSGTFQDDGYSDYISIQSLTGPKIGKIRAKELQSKNIISNVKIVQTHLNHDRPDFYQKLKEARKGGGNSVGAKIYQLETEFIRNSDDRLKFICNLVKKIQKNTLILYNILDYGDKIFNYINDNHVVYSNGSYELYMINGEVKKDERNEILKKMELNDGVIRVLVATYGTLSTGISVKNLHNVVFAESFKSEQRIIQSVGRALRLYKTKDHAVIIDIVDHFDDTPNLNKNILFRHGEERLKMYKTHEYPYKIKKFYLN